MSQAAKLIGCADRGLSRWVETTAAAWTNDPDREIFDQTRIGRSGYAVTLLWANAPDDYEGAPGILELGAPGFGPRR